MARKPNYSFERRERERVKAAKKAARLEAKREKSEKRKAEAAGLPWPDETAEATAEPQGQPQEDPSGQPREDNGPES
ncbi:MAG: hypothetical protein QGH73_00525 [Rhodospirillales bacterium]|nr:hypothetical protein [Rhodospirillaceae bacterium]MDP6430452.1 hypothetical protein [Rhodospirillales bacterium]MDP6646501.1 hypothetical protein [Rhodospirillales bacterium]MDP6840142.1 hypothetical protein [Rhodospirillales bacterium]|tara:strand:- start:169 stop:399 length:231 start_codon:yes stop_codon:yes gene_type:complete